MVGKFYGGLLDFESIAAGLRLIEWVPQEVLKKYPSVECYATDIIEPSEPLEGCRFTIGDVLEGLAWRDGYFDLVHMSFLISVIPVRQTR